MRAFAVLAVLGALAGSSFAEDLPEIQSKAMIVLDAETGREIHGKAADEVRPIASTTKIFVAMAVRKRNLPLDGWTEITRVDVEAARGGARTRLALRESFRNRDLLRAMLIASDNRAPTALGRAAGMSPKELVAAMNKIAKDLGLTRTRFVDPTGLRGNESTAREMALALRAALDDKVLRDIMATPEATIVSKDRSTRVDYHTTNVPLAASKYHITGGKTGFTTPAGYCYITGAEIGGRKVLLSFLGAPGKYARFDDFGRVAAWLERGAPGSRRASQKARPAPEGEDAPARRRGPARVATP